MSARDTILSAVRAAAVPPAPPAIPPAAGALTGGMHQAFLRVLAEVGGQGGVRHRSQTLKEALDELGGVALEGSVVVPGRFAVAENGAVYVDADDVTQRDVIVRSEHLVLVVPFEALVPTMHEAVRLIPLTSPCGWFLSGPSKTADIEQSLVFGAQGSRTLRVIFQVS